MREDKMVAVVKSIELLTSEGQDFNPRAGGRPEPRIRLVLEMDVDAWDAVRGQQYLRVARTEA